MHRASEQAPPVVAVVVAAFQAERHLGATLRSIQTQTLTDWVCLVVDDGSTDGTGEIAQAFAAVDTRFTVIEQANAGVSAARNAGLDQVPAGVRWLAFVDSDDMLVADAFAKLLAAVDQHEDAVGAYGLAEFVDTTGQPVRPGVHPALQRERRQASGWSISDVPDGADTTFDCLVVSGPIWPPAVGLFRRDTVDRSGRFDPEQRLVEDWDLFLRMSRQGPFVFLDKQVAWYRRHSSNLSNDSRDMTYYWSRVRAKAWADPANTRMQRQMMRRVWLRQLGKTMAQNTTAALKAVRHGDREDARTAGSSLARCAWQLVHGHPVAARRPAEPVPVADEPAIRPRPDSVARVHTDGRPPTVAVIVPAFNAEHYLAATLRSIQEQTFRDWVCIVIDDGSTDGTAGVADHFVSTDRRFHLHRQANAGLPSARNSGLDRVPAAARWISFVDSDDTLTPDAFEGLLASASHRDDAAGVFGLAEHMDANGEPIQHGVHPAAQRDRRRPSRWDLEDAPLEDDVAFNSLIVSGTIWPPAVGLFRRDLIEDAGRFDPVQRYNEDWDLWVRMSRFGPFIPLDRQVAWYRQHDTNMTKNVPAMTYFRARVWSKAWEDPANTPEQRQVIRHVWLRYQLRWIAWTAVAGTRAVGHGDFRQAGRATEALMHFGRNLSRSRPVEPNEATIAAMVEFANR